jgi:hypothetical protein
MREKEEEKEEMGRRWTPGMAMMLPTLSDVGATTAFAWRRHLFARRLVDFSHLILPRQAVPPFSSGAAWVTLPALSRLQALLPHQ